MAAPVLPYPDMDFTPLDILTAEEMNQMVANDEYLKTYAAGLADGTNLSDGIIQARNIASGAVNSDKIASGAVTNEKLGSSSVKSPNIDWSSIIDKLYPVGSIYQSTSSTNPSTFLGGTWTQISYVTFRVNSKTNFAFNVSGGVSALTKLANIVAYPFENNENTRYQIWDNTQRIYMWRRTA